MWTALLYDRWTCAFIPIPRWKGSWNWMDHGADPLFSTLSVSLLFSHLLLYPFHLLILSLPSPFHLLILSLPSPFSPSFPRFLSYLHIFTLFPFFFFFFFISHYFSFFLPYTHLLSNFYTPSIFVFLSFQFIMPLWRVLWVRMWEHQAKVKVVLL